VILKPKLSVMVMLCHLEDARRKASLVRLPTALCSVGLSLVILGYFTPTADASTVPLEERLRVMVEHTELFVELAAIQKFGGNEKAL
jgi:hypothetical protein